MNDFFFFFACYETARWKCKLSNLVHIFSYWSWDCNSSEFHILISGCPSQWSLQVSLSYNFNLAQISGSQLCEIHSSTVYLLHLLSKTQNYLFSKMKCKYGAENENRSICAAKTIACISYCNSLILSLQTGYFLLCCRLWIVLHSYPVLQEVETDTTALEQFLYMLTFDQQHPPAPPILLVNQLKTITKLYWKYLQGVSFTVSGSDS